MFDGVAEESNALSGDPKSTEIKTANSTKEISNSDAEATADVATPMRHPNQLAHGDAPTLLELSPIFNNQQHAGSAKIMLTGNDEDEWQNAQEAAKEWSGFASDEFSAEHSRSKEISFGFDEESSIKTTVESIGDITLT